MRVIFFYPGRRGHLCRQRRSHPLRERIIHIKSNQEETTTFLQNCEILWKYETEADDRANKVRLLKPKSGNEAVQAAPAPARPTARLQAGVQPVPGGPKNPDFQ